CALCFIGLYHASLTLGVSQWIGGSGGPVGRDNQANSENNKRDRQELSPGHPAHKVKANMAVRLAYKLHPEAETGVAHQEKPASGTSRARPSGKPEDDDK